jgi:hypothetical protein
MSAQHARSNEAIDKPRRVVGFTFRRNMSECWYSLRAFVDVQRISVLKVYI